MGAPGWVMLALGLLIGTGCGDCGRAACGVGNDDDDLEPASREVGTLEVGGHTANVSASLTGRYVRVHGGGGRLGYSCITDDERWTLRLTVRDPEGGAGHAGSHEGVGIITLSNAATRGGSRADALETMEGLGLEVCPGATSERAIFRITGWEDAPFMTADLRAGPHLVLAPIEVAEGEAPPTDCAAASAEARDWPTLARGVWERMAIRRVNESARDSLSVGGGFEWTSRAGSDVCHVLLADGSLGEALRCRWGHGTAAGETLAARIGREPRLAQLVIEALGPRPARAEPQPVDAAVTDGLQRVGRTYVDALTASPAANAFVDLATEACVSNACAPGVAPCLGCTPSVLESAARLAQRLDAESPDARRCAAVQHAALRILSDDGPGGATDDETNETYAWRTRALAMLRATRGCGDEDTLRAAFRLGIGLASIDPEGPPTGNRCQTHEFDERENEGMYCRRLEAVSAEWLSRRCDAESLRLATEHIEGVPDEHRDPRANSTFNASLRIVTRCDTDALAAIFATMAPRHVRAWRYGFRLCRTETQQEAAWCAPLEPPAPSETAEGTNSEGPGHGAEGEAASDESGSSSDRPPGEP